MKRDQKAKYKTLTQVLAAGNKFTEPFELTPEVDGFIAKYKLGKDIELLPEVGEGGEKEAKLVSKVAQELKRTYDLFMSEKYFQERLEEAHESIIKQTKELIKKVAKKYASKIKVDLGEDHNDGLNYYAIKINLELGDEEETIEPSALYYSYEPGVGLSEAAEGSSDRINWAAWLGMDESPFGDEEFVTAYDHDEMSNAIDQMVETLKETMFEEDLTQAIQKLVAKHEHVEE